MSRRERTCVVVCGLVVTVFVWWPGLVAMVAGVVARSYFGVPLRRLQAAAVGLLVVTPFVWLISNVHRMSDLSPQLVTLAPWPGRLAAGALALAGFALLLELAGLPETLPARRRVRRARAVEEAEVADG